MSMEKRGDEETKSRDALVDASYNSLVKETAEGFLADGLWKSKREEDLHREIEAMSSEKAKCLFDDERDRRAWVAAIKKSVENSIQSQVRAVLGTPPGERRKKLHEQRLAEERRKRQIEIENADRQRTAESRNYSYPSFHDDDGALFQKRQQYLQKFAMRRSMRNDKTSASTTLRDFDIDPLSSEFNKKFSIYTRAALENADRTSSNMSFNNQANVYKRSPGCVWVDKKGERHDIPGPFWPKDHLPRYSTQKHIHFIPDFVERLNTEGENCNTSTSSVANGSLLYPHEWRGNLTVYERHNKGEANHSHVVPFGCPPCLTFESRFECGNLKQAKRIGSYEYDLVLSCDLYTKRHMQWYYFRVQNMVPGVTYKFNIINLLKKDSLYNYGMKPLLYSEREATARGLGWKRAGSHISYCKTTLYKNPLLQREYVYYTLTFHMEFPHENDTCYLAHCYPYSYTDLELYLRTMEDNPKTAQYVQKEVLCKTMAGNNCHVLTITSPQVPESEKLGVVVSARVHPGETNASWMMKGMLDFLTCGHHIAEKLRRKFVFKLVPMLNPDGVVVGNYRTNLAARDLNRTYKDPKKESFPTVWHMKNMLESFKKDHQVIIYCDLHGHSRKPNVFMYGCTADPKMASMSNFVEERLFPWMMSQKFHEDATGGQLAEVVTTRPYVMKFAHSTPTQPLIQSKTDNVKIFCKQEITVIFPETAIAIYQDLDVTKAPDKFSFSGCKFRVRKCKESTARVVMWRQMGITNSFTMEATFCGANFGDIEKGRHFHVGDFEEMGRDFCEVLLEYSEAKNGNRSEMTQAFVELACKMTRDILRQTLGNFNHENVSKEDFVMSNNGTTHTREGKTQNSLSLGEEDTEDQRTNSTIKAFPLSTKKKVNFMDVRVQAPGSSVDDGVELSVKSVHVDSFNDCIKILENLNLVDCFDESDSSDSDSDTDDWDDKEDEASGNPGERKRKKKKRKKAKHWWDTLSKPSASSETSNSTTTDEDCGNNEKKVKTNFGKFVNPYQHRSNGGIPIFSQERILERAKKKEEQLHNGSQETERKDFLVKYAHEEPKHSGPVLAVTDDTELNFITAQRRLEYYMFANNSTNPNWGNLSTNSGLRNKPPLPHSRHVVEMDSFKFDYLTGDGYGFTVRIPGRKPHRARTRDGLERGARHSLQTFEEARSRLRRKQISPAYTFDLSDERIVFPGRTPSLYTTHHNTYYGDDFEEDPDVFSRVSASWRLEHSEFRRGMTGLSEGDILGQRKRNFARSRSEHGMRVRSKDLDEVTSQSAGHRSRHDRPLFEPKAPVPSYSHVSAPLVNKKQR